MPELTRAPWPPPPQSSGSASQFQRASGRRRIWIGVGVVSAVAVVTAIAVTALLVGPRWVRVEGHAMSPTLQDGDRAIFVRVLQPPSRGSVVALRYPKNPAKSFVMRIVGLPGERVSIDDGIVSINSQPIAEPYLVEANRSHEAMAPRQLGDQEYFVMGDNRRNASDSREWGPVARGLIWATIYTVVAHGASTPR